ncbi:tetratricopeptide repeat protein [Methanolobus sp. ZRKC3]|uniref:tetratricopeptide repeat protein n=1 Tax=Methanolobus sp. ZRKC3 TaxID=3125786 RepID=UPI0032469852
MKESKRNVSRKWTQQGIKETDPDRKLHYFNLALEVNPYDIISLNQKGMLLHKAGEYEKAINCYDRILAQVDTEKTVSAIYNKSLALKAMGKYEAALNYLNKVIRQDPDNPRVKDQKASVLKLMGKVGDSKKVPDQNSIPLKKLAVNIIYSEWNPPSASNLLADSMKCSRSDIKYHKGLGEDIIQEKAIQDKLNKRVYSCAICRFQEKEVCNYPETKGMAVSATAICRHFKPIKGI